MATAEVPMDKCRRIYLGNNVPRTKALKLLDSVRRSIWCAAVIFGTAQAQVRNDYCGALPPTGFDLPPNQPRTGRYLNIIYGYSVAIPQGLTAYSAGEGAERGFILSLSEKPRAFVRVDASYDVFYDITAAGVHRRDLNAIRLHDTLLDDQPVELALQRVEGARYRMHLKCHDGSGTVAHEEIIVLRNREIYRLDLQTTPERYLADSRLLDQMLKSWRWEALQ
jgi:hypothetical protein